MNFLKENQILIAADVTVNTSDTSTELQYYDYWTITSHRIYSLK